MCETIICNKCKIEKDEDKFYFHKKTGKRWRICKLCKSRGPAKIKERLESKSLSREEKDKMNIRECLNCNRDFPSISKFNRLCRPCKESNLEY